MSTSDDPLTGIVAATALSASLALRVLKSVLEVVARKGPEARLRELIEAAQKAAEGLEELAAEDGAAYAAYVQARKERSAQVQDALRRAVETPLNVARAAAAGISLCLEAAGYTSGAIATDVAGAAALLEGGVRATLCTVDTNLRALKDKEFAHRAAAEGEALKMHAIHQAGAVLTAVKKASNSDRTRPQA